MRLSWRASTSALFRLSSSSTSFRRRPFSPLAAAVSPPSHQLCSQRRIRTPAPFPRRMASAAATSADATGPSKDHDQDDAALKSWDERDPVRFATHPIPRSTIFAVSRRSFAFVNLRPVVPGHVLVSSKRVAPRFADLTAEEVSDLWLLAQKVGRVAERKQQLEREEREGKASSSPSSSASASPSSALTFALQDGASAGSRSLTSTCTSSLAGGPGTGSTGRRRTTSFTLSCREPGPRSRGSSPLEKKRRRLPPPLLPLPLLPLPPLPLLLLFRPRTLSRGRGRTAPCKRWKRRPRR